MWWFNIRASPALFLVVVIAMSYEGESFVDDQNQTSLIDFKFSIICYSGFPNEN